MIVHLPAILVAAAGLLGTIGGGVAWVYRVIAKRIETVERELAKCEDREKEAINRRARMWRVIDLLLDAIEELGPDHRQMVRARGLLAQLREDDRETPLQLEPAE